MQREKNEPEQIRKEVPKPRKDFTGWIGWKQPEGRLTVEAITGYNAAHRRLARCCCSCGNVVEVPVSYVIHQKIRSCGCLKREMLVERNRTHGGTGSRLYRIWDHARRRCNNQNDKAFKDYGGRGIHFFPAWNDFEIFRSWAYQNGYRDDLTLDRLDNDGDYDPENCTWTTIAEQQGNRRNNVLIEVEGDLLTLAEASRRTGINRQTLADRLRAGKTGADLFQQPKQPSDRSLIPAPPDQEAGSL